MPISISSATTKWQQWSGWVGSHFPWRHPFSKSPGSEAGANGERGATPALSAGLLLIESSLEEGGNAHTSLNILSNLSLFISALSDRCPLHFTSHRFFVQLRYGNFPAGELTEKVAAVLKALVVLTSDGISNGLVESLNGLPGGL